MEGKWKPKSDDPAQDYVFISPKVERLLEDEEDDTAHRQGVTDPCILARRSLLQALAQQSTG